MPAKAFPRQRRRESISTQSRVTATASGTVQTSVTHQLFAAGIGYRRVYSFRAQASSPPGGGRLKYTFGRLASLQTASSVARWLLRVAVPSVSVGISRAKSN